MFHDPRAAAATPVRAETPEAPASDPWPLLPPRPSLDRLLDLLEAPAPGARRAEGARR